MSTTPQSRSDRPKYFALLLVLIALLAPATANAATPAETRAQTASGACANADVLPTAANQVQVRAATLCLMNAERTARGLRPLRAQMTLAQVAGAYANLMGRQQFFDHVSPTGSTVLSRIKATTYLRHMSDWEVGENIAWGAGTFASPRATVQAWMNSAPHRANLLSRDFTQVGIGVANGGGTPDVNPTNTGTTYVTNFGFRTR